MLQSVITEIQKGYSAMKQFTENYSVLHESKNNTPPLPVRYQEATA